MQMCARKNLLLSSYLIRKIFSFVQFRNNLDGESKRELSCFNEFVKSTAEYFVKQENFTGELSSLSVTASESVSMESSNKNFLKIIIDFVLLCCGK
jgi:hypothetical protein